MMKKNLFLTAILTAGILLIPFHSLFAESTSASKTRNIDLIIEKSGILAQVNMIPALINEPSLKKEPEQKAESERAKQIDAIFQNDFTAENLLAEIKQTLGKQYNEKYAGEVVKFYDSELGAKIVQCEIASAAPSFAEKTEGFDIENYDQKRRRLINRLFDDMKILDYQSKIQALILEFIIRSTNASFPKDFRSPDADIIDVWGQINDLANSKDLGDRQRSFLLSQFYVTYDGVTTDELVKYHKFVKSKPGKWMNQCAQTGLIHGLKKCADQAIIDLMAYTDSHPQAEEAETDEFGDI
jgi:hypothetical protein